MNKENIKFVPFITLSDGRRIFARNYGYKAFPIKVNKKEKKSKKNK